jgi:hypothetical protein
MKKAPKTREISNFWQFSVCAGSDPAQLFWSGVGGKALYKGFFLK